LGNVPGERLEALLDAAAAIDEAAFDLCLDAGGWWRRPGIWRLTPSTVPAPLPALAGALAEAAGRVGLPVRRQDFQPHVTLMRKVNTALPVPVFTPLHWHARDFLLLQSITRQEGPEYRELGRWPLRR